MWDLLEMLLEPIAGLIFEYLCFLLSRVWRVALAAPSQMLS